MKELKLVDMVRPEFFIKDLLSSNVIYLGENHSIPEVHWENQKKIIDKVRRSGKPFRVAFENFPSNMQGLFKEPIFIHKIDEYLKTKYQDAYKTMMPLIMTSLANGIYRNLGLVAMGKPAITGVAHSCDDMEDHMSEILQPILSSDIMTICLNGNVHLERNDGFQYRLDTPGLKETVVLQPSDAKNSRDGIFYLNPSSGKDPKYAVVGRINL